MSVKSVQAILNGTTYTLALNSSTGDYEATLTAPNESSYNNNAGHYFPVTIKATDDAGNVTTINDTDSTFGENLKLQVKETVLPVIVISSPTDSEITSNAKPTVNWTVTDSGSGVSPDTIGITIDEGNKIIVSFRNSKNMNQNWISFGYAMHWIRTCLTVNRAKGVLKQACRIQGTGFLFYLPIALSFFMGFFLLYAFFFLWIGVLISIFVRIVQKIISINIPNIA